MDSKDNPYKPNTQEWSDYEKTIINDQTYFTSSPEYKEAKAVADKRIKTAGERYAAEYEKGVWVDEILEFLDGDEPEYDEELDGPVDNYWRSMAHNVDPLNWNQIVATHYQQYAAFLKPVFNGNHVMPKNLPSNISDEQLYSTIIDVSMREYPEETYRLGWVAVPIKRPISLAVQSILDPTDLDYSVAEFYIRRKT